MLLIVNWARNQRLSPAYARLEAGTACLLQVCVVRLRSPELSFKNERRHFTREITIIRGLHLGASNHEAVFLQHS